MTNTASTRRSVSPCWVSMNACAVPAKRADMVGGSSSADSFVMASTAVPSDAADARLNEIVTDGSCPEWFTVTGPTEYVNFATALSGTSGPRVERTQSLPSASTSCWYFGSSSITTQYSFVAV